MNTENFRSLINLGDPQSLHQAEAFLMNVKANRWYYHQYDNRWIDHREKELFGAYRDADNLKKALEIALMSIFPKSRDGRIKNLQHIFGKEKVKEAKAKVEMKSTKVTIFIFE